MGNIVAIVGRPNVGKSTLFNRLVQRREAIVDAVSGVTRDRNYGKSEWNGRTFSVIDTGGYILGSDDVFEAEIDKQVELAIDEADVIIFMVDVESGVTGMDNDVADLLRKAKKPVFLAVNKVDSSMRESDAAEFYALGLGDYYTIASISGSGTGDLLDAVVEALPKQDEPEEDELPRFAVVGRPNAGKSSFINALIGEERYIVTDIAGTTRDAVDTRYKGFGFEFNLVDTAGIRKKSRVSEDLEFYSVMRSVRAIEHSDVCILIVDATRGFEGQDQSIFWLAEKNKKGIVILVNKWDLVEKKMAMEEYRRMVYERIPHTKFAPVVFTSAKTGKNLEKILETDLRVYGQLNRRIKTPALNKVLEELLQRQSLSYQRGKRINILYTNQVKTMPPTFVLFTNFPELIPEHYKRYLENSLREKYGFIGAPIRLLFRKK